MSAQYWTCPNCGAFLTPFHSHCHNCGRSGGMATSEHSVSGAVELSVDDPDDFEMLYDEFRGAVGIQVEAIPAPINEGDQGSVLEFLTVACSGGAITVALEIVKTLIESRGPKFILKARRGKDRLEVTTDNVDEVLPLLREMFGD